MAITGTLVEQGQNRLRYLITATDTSDLDIDITSTGAATPDLLTDSAGTNGIVRKLAKAFTNGYGKLAAGVLTQAQARALWLSDDPTNTVAAAGNGLVATAVSRIAARGNNLTPIAAQVDANVDGGGHPILTVTLSAAGSVYLDVEVLNTIGA